MTTRMIPLDYVQNILMEDEWEETQLKAKSLLGIIGQLSKNKDDKNALQSTLN